MTFASLEFGALLLLTFGLYYFLPQRGRMILMLAVSYVFYCYWNPMYGVLIFASTALDYLAAIYIHRHSRRGLRRLGLIASVVGNLGLLGYFKYTDFALDSLRALLGPLGANLPGPLNLILPAGISFYTFQTMSYTIDVYRGKHPPERDFLLVALYVSFFPQLVAGPIERAHDLLPQLARRHAFALHNIEEGGRLILWGLFKKLVVADRLTAAAFPVYRWPDHFDSAQIAFGVTAMFVVIYLDFSAYTEIATGTARLFGIRLSRNFNFPQVSTNIAEFWRRWHMTMSTWVRDYLYMPLGGFHPRDMMLHARVTLVTMALVGLWHGAQWTFVLWGVGHGICLVSYQFLHIYVLRRYRRSSTLKGVPWRMSAWTLNTSIRVLLSVLFFAPTLAAAGVIFSRLFVHPSWPVEFRPELLAGSAVLAGFWIWHYLHYRLAPAAWFLSLHPAARGALYAAGVYFVMFGAVESSEPFIYFQF
jgi:D-alanyl-lipoteichoic acid acyltransferase DltB (MBOAT superfamily)